MLPNIYEAKIAEYTDSLKFKQLPLLSWDIHMQNLRKITATQKDIRYISNLNNTTRTEVDILKEFVDNKAVIVITDINLKIEFATNNMIEMAGYQPVEVIGFSPKMFQGPETDMEISKGIRSMVNSQQKFEYTLVNYKKDKSTYNCHIKGFPMYSKKGELIKYVAIEKVA